MSAERPRPPAWPERPRAALARKGSSIILLPHQPLVAADVVNTEGNHIGHQLLARILADFRIRGFVRETGFIDIWQAVGAPGGDSYNFTVAHPAFIRAIHRHGVAAPAPETTLPIVLPDSLTVIAPEATDELRRINLQREEKERRQADFEASLRALIPNALPGILAQADETTLMHLRLAAAESATDVLDERQRRLALHTAMIAPPIGRTAVGNVINIGSGLVGPTGEMIAKDHFGIQFDQVEMPDGKAARVVRIINHTVFDLTVISASADNPMLLRP